MFCSCVSTRVKGSCPGGESRGSGRGSAGELGEAAEGEGRGSAEEGRYEERCSRKVGLGSRDRATRCQEYEVPNTKTDLRREEATQEGVVRRSYSGHPFPKSRLSETDGERRDAVSKEARPSEEGTGDRGACTERGETREAERDATRGAENTTGRGVARRGRGSSSK